MALYHCESCGDPTLEPIRQLGVAYEAGRARPVSRLLCWTCHQGTAQTRASILDSP